MKHRLGIGILCATGLLVSSAPASADGFGFGFGVGFGGGHSSHHGRSHRRHGGDDAVAAGIGFLTGVVIGAAIEHSSRPRHVVYAPPPVMYAPPPVAYGPAPVYYAPPPVAYAPPPPAPAVAYAPHVDPCACCCRVYVPPRTTWREETVCEPAVSEDRCVPVYEDVEVPVCEMVPVPVYEQCCDPVTKEMVAVKVGERLESRQVGTRLDRICVGTRVERVVVRPATTRVVRVPETVPGHYVTVCESRGHRHEGQVWTRSQYESAIVVAGARERGRPIR